MVSIVHPVQLQCTIEEAEMVWAKRVYFKDRNCKHVLTEKPELEKRHVKHNYIKTKKLKN